MAVNKYIGVLGKSHITDLQQKQPHLKFTKLQTKAICAPLEIHVWCIDEVTRCRARL